MPSDWLRRRSQATIRRSRTIAPTGMAAQYWHAVPQAYYRSLIIVPVPLGAAFVIVPVLVPTGVLTIPSGVVPILVPPMVLSTPAEIVVPTPVGVVIPGDVVVVVPAGVIG